MRKDQHNYREQPYLFKKSRKRIETLFSQLCDQFMIRRNCAKYFKEFKTRILAKIIALTTIIVIVCLTKCLVNIYLKRLQRENSKTA